MHMQAIELARVAQRAVRPGIRWGSVFAGTCVGIACYVLLMLIGICAGMASLGRGDASAAALGWNLLSAFSASLLGSFVAARSADLYSAAEGAMLGLVVWSCAAVLVTLVGLSLVRDVTGNMVLLMAQNAERETAMTPYAPMPRPSGLRNTAHTPVYSDGPRIDRMRPAVPVMGEEAPAARGRGFDFSAFAALMACAGLAISLFGSIAGALMGTRTPRPAKPLRATDLTVDDLS